MKNYYDEAKKIKININPYCDLNYLKNYRINKKRNFVELIYMNGNGSREFLDERTKEVFDQRQRNDLNRIEEKLKEKTSSDIRYNSSIASIYAIAGTALLALNNMGGIVWLTGAGYFLTKAIKPLKLKKDIQLAAWIYDNRKDVDQIIQEEVESRMERKEITCVTNNAPEPKYPTDLVQYSQNMYENGIDLNNIDELNNKQLRKLKRKVLKKRKKSINE